MNPAVTKLILPIGLAAVLVLSLAIGITQALQVSKHEAAAAAASDLAISSYDSADSFDSLAADARISKEACYYNDYCSSDSYSNWINIVDTDEALAESSRQTADEAFLEADRETKAKTGSQVASIVGFVFAGLSAAGLGLVLVLRGRKKKPAPVVTYDADAATPAE